MRFKSIMKYFIVIICAITMYESSRYVYHYLKHSLAIADTSCVTEKIDCGQKFEDCNKTSIMEKIAELSSRLDKIRPNSAESIPINPELTAYSDGIADMISEVMDSTVSIATMEDDELSMMNISEIIKHHYLKGIVTNDFMYGFLNSDKKKLSTVQGSLGSGFIIKIENGIAYVVTNNHVIAGAKSVTIFLNDKTAIPAEIQGFDEMIDIAVLKFNMSHIGKHKIRLYPLKWGDSSRMREGNIVFAIGNPFGLGGTVTNGIISSMKRNIHDDLVLNHNFQRDVYIQSSNFIQHNASINVGSSGGCLINTNGEVIGVNRNIVPGSDEDGGNIGIALAIPSNIAKIIVDKIILKGGAINRGWMGIVTQFIASKEFAAFYGNGIEHNIGNCGFFVSSVLNGSSAHKKGIKQCDIIIALNGKRITSNTDLMNFVSMANIGETAELTILRQDGNKFKTIKVNVEISDISTYDIHSDSDNKHNNNDRKVGSNIRAIDINDVGISVKDLPKFVTENKKFANNAKVIVTYTEIANAPYSTSFEIGDGVVMADGKNVQNAYQLKMIVEQAINEGKRYISFVVQRGKTYQMISKTINGISQSKHHTKANTAVNINTKQNHNNNQGAEHNQYTHGRTNLGATPHNSNINTTKNNNQPYNANREKQQCGTRNVNPNAQNNTRERAKPGNNVRY